MPYADPQARQAYRKAYYLKNRAAACMYARTWAGAQPEAQVIRWRVESLRRMPKKSRAFTDKARRLSNAVRCKATDAVNAGRQRAKRLGYTPLALTRAQVEHALRLTSVCQCGVTCKEDTAVNTGPRRISGRTANVEHCHTTGRFRGIVCNACNMWVRDAEKALYKGTIRPHTKALLDKYYEQAHCLHEYFSTWSEPLTLEHAA